MANIEKPIVAPKPVEKPKADYVYTGEKNYEAPKPDPWIEESK